MKPGAEAIVGLAAFTAAAASKPWQRTPAGVRVSVPRDTLLYQEGDALVVDTPTLRSRVPMTGAWPACVSVKAASLALVCQKLKPAETLSLILAAGSLILDTGAFTLRATKKRRRPE